MHNSKYDKKEKEISLRNMLQKKGISESEHLTDDILTLLQGEKIPTEVTKIKEYKDVLIPY